MDGIKPSAVSQRNKVRRLSRRINSKVQVILPGTDGQAGYSAVPDGLLRARRPVDVRPAVVTVDLLVVTPEELAQARHVETTLAVRSKIDERAAHGLRLVEREVELTKSRVLDRHLGVPDPSPIAALVDVGEDQGSLDVAGLSEIDRHNFATAAPIVAAEGDVGRCVEVTEVLVERLNDMWLRAVGQFVHHGQVDVGLARPGQNDLDKTVVDLGQIDGGRHGLLFEIAHINRHALFSLGVVGNYRFSSY